MPESRPIVPARGTRGIVQQRVLVWLAVAIIAVIRVLYFPKCSVSLQALPALLIGLLALLLIGELTVRILDWARRRAGSVRPGGVYGPVGPLLDKLSTGDVVFHRLRLAPGLIEHLVFRPGVVFLIETHPGFGTVARQRGVFRLNGRPLSADLFKRARRKLEWLENFLTAELRCTPRLQAGLVFPNAQVAPGYHTDGVALLGMEHLQPWLDTAPPDEQFSKRLWPQMSMLQRELLAASKPTPEPMQALPFGLVLVLGAVWLALSETSGAKPATTPALAAQPGHSPTGRAFNKIQLEGVGGIPPRRVAIINGQTLRQGEWTMIKVAGRDVGIRCKSILGDSAIIGIDGVDGTTTLHLRRGAGETQASNNRR